MATRAKFWLVVADLFTVVNLLGAGAAAAQGQMLHATIHLGLVGLTTYVLWRLGVGSRRLEQPAALPAALPAGERLDELQRSIDAIALEMERIGELQRFDAKLQAERAKTER